MNSRIPGEAGRNMTDPKGSFTYVSSVDVSLGAVGYPDEALDAEPPREMLR
jgi:hypothetical protein